MDGLILCLISIPRIIYIAKKRKLFDLPDHNRKIHLAITPNIGGMGIFFGYIITIALFIKPDLFPQLHFIIASSFVLFLTGLYDDLASVNAYSKFIAQFIAAIITIYFADIRITSLHGILGIYELPRWFSIIFSIIGCVFVTNAINLIDGIDGLAGSIGILTCSALAICLASSGTMEGIGGACIAIGLMGATLGFLRYNVPPAKIFMGDTGSLFMGFNIAVLAILCVNSFHDGSPLTAVIHSQKGILIVTLSIIFVPVFDSFRVFINRILKGTSPFKADRTHLHHLLLDAGFTHSEAVGILITSNILIITIALYMQDEDPNLAIGAILLVSFLLFGILYYSRKKRLMRNQALIEKNNPVSSQPAEKKSNQTLPSANEA
jgi:UDP-N-acetylmuramyl pentapeptide phosphotransferase/UDP-N-acetylglucosamine-1-phosphate transferase